MKSLEILKIIEKYAIPNRFGEYCVYADKDEDLHTDITSTCSRSLLTSLRSAEKLSNTHFVEVWGDDVLVTGEPGSGLEPFGPTRLR